MIKRPLSYTARADETAGMTIVRNAILLAAGLGTRMRPLTATTPKPLLNLGGRSLLDHALDRLASQGVETVVVNAHWHAAHLSAHLAGREGPPRTIVRHEADLLDTGGAVAAALADGCLGEAPFFVVNGDTVWLDGPVPALRRVAAALTGDVDGVILVHRTFQVHSDVGPGDFFLDSWGRPRRRGEREIAPYIFAGVTLARPQLFRDGQAALHGGQAFSMNQVWDRAIAARRLGAVVHDGLWFHFTRPDDLHEAEHALIAQLTGPTT
jgi:MurNAc alpha-1-phosphate uridylyltransferase